MASGRSSQGPGPVQEVAKGVWRLPQRGVNAYAVQAPEGTVLVDAGNPGDGRRILDALAALGLGPPRLVLITHADVDHAGGAREIGRASGAEVLASPLEAEVLRGGGRPRLLRRLGRLMIGRLSVEAALVAGATVAGLTVLATPGHTRGHISLLREADGVLFAGDALAVHGEGVRIAKPPYTEDVGAACVSLGQIALRQPHLLLPGHGRPLAEPAAALARALLDCPGGAGG